MIVVDLIEDQAYNQLRHGSTHLDGQHLPLRRLHRVGVLRLGEQIELACRGLARLTKRVHLWPSNGATAVSTFALAVSNTPQTAASTVTLTLSDTGLLTVDNQRSGIGLVKINKLI